MTNREMISAVLARQHDLPTPQQWMSFFNGDTARRLTPSDCHYDPMWLYDVPGEFSSAAMGPAALDAMIRFNRFTDRCLMCPSHGGNIAFGHGGPGEFRSRILERSDNHLIAEYETQVKAHVQFEPHFYHNDQQPVRSADDLKRLQLPDPAAPARWQGFAEDVRYLKSQGEYVVASLNGFFSGVHYFLMDYELTLVALAAEPELLQRVLDMLGEWNLAAAQCLIDAGVDGITLCDDLGSKEALLMSPAMYRRYFKPYHQKLCQLAHDQGVTVHLHSHGAIQDLLDDMIEFDFINPFDPEEGFDLEDILRRYGEHFVVVGGLPTSFWYQTPDEQRVTLERLDRLGRTHGGLIIMDSGGVPDDVTAERFAEILQISRDVRGLVGG